MFFVFDKSDNFGFGHFMIVFFIVVVDVIVLEKTNLWRKKKKNILTSGE